LVAESLLNELVKVRREDNLDVTLVDEPRNAFVGISRLFFSAFGLVVRRLKELFKEFPPFGLSSCEPLDEVLVRCRLIVGFLVPLDGVSILAD